MLLLVFFLIGMQTICVHLETDIPKWDRVSVTFGKWSPLPLTESEAKEKKWTLLSDDCQVDAAPSRWNFFKWLKWKVSAPKERSPFLGKRYTLNGARDTTVIFDTKGQIAGLQLGYLVAGDVRPDPKLEEYVKVEEDGKPYIYLTAYFTDPNNICKSTYERDAKVVADKLVFLKRDRKTNINGYTYIPLYAEEKLGSNWIQGLCVPAMGMHYFVGISADMDCDDWYPFFLMYNKGKLESWGYFTFDKIPSPRLEHPGHGVEKKMIKPADVPKCLDAIPDVVSQHVYFTQVTQTSHLCTYYEAAGRNSEAPREYHPV